MKHVAKIVILSLLISLTQSTILTSYSFAEETNTIVKEEKKSSLSIFERIWMKIRSLSPKKKKMRSASAVAGVKGAEKGSEELAPYWKGEKKSTLDKEIEKYGIAEDLMEDGKFSEAIISFDNFIEEFPASRFAPNARFSKELCLLKTDQIDEAKKGLNAFIDAYPSHELTSDAEELMAALNEDQNNF